jgi:hypothetical protein
MALLVDGKPFRLDDLAIKDFARNYTYIVPKTAVRIRPDNGLLEVANGFGIPTEYRMIDKNSGRELTVRYYESSYYDDGIKREVYSPSNIMIDSTGKIMIPSVQAELNWFLNNHPGLEEGVQRKNYPRYPILFRLLNKPKAAENKLELFRLRKELSEYIDPESKKAWKYDQLVAACELLCNDKEFASIPNGLVMPKDILSYQEMGQERDEKTREGNEMIMRSALLGLIDAYPEYTKDRLVNSIERRIMLLINKVDQFDITGVRFDLKTRKWIETDKDKAVPFLAVPENVEPKKHLLKECKKDPKLLAKIEELASLVPTY